MNQLLTIREYIKAFVSRNESYCKPISKLLLTVISISVLNGRVGYASRLDNFAIVLIAALLTSFLPVGFIPVMAGAFLMLHMYALSLETFIVVGVLVLIMFLLYLRFSPKDTILLVITPIFFVMRIPYVIPLVAGLVAAPSAVISIGCGVVLYFVLSVISTNVSGITALAEAETLEKIRFILQLLIDNKEMIVFAVAFGVTAIIVWIIRRLPVDHAWRIAMVAGALTDIVVLFAADLKVGAYVSVGGVLFGSLVGLVISLVIQFFLFDLDYSRTEKVQFEDDDYYYFVKAVPKNTVRIYEDDDDEEEEELPRPKRIKEEKERKTERSDRRPERNSNTHQEKKPEKRTEKSPERKPEKKGTSQGKVKSAGEPAKKQGRKEYLPDDYVPEYRIKREKDGLDVEGIDEYARLSGIERAAAAKARATRQQQKNNNN